MNDFSNEVNTPTEVNTGEVQQTNEAPQINPGAIRKSTTQSILKAASQAAGMDFDSVESMAAAFARLSAQSAMAQQPKQEQVEQPKGRVRTSDLEEQFVTLKQDLAKKEQALREKELDGDIRSAMGDKFDSDLLDYALQKVKSNIVWEDGSYSIVNSRGQMRYGEDGSPLTIAGLVNEVAKANPKLLKMGRPSGGSGLQAQGNGYSGLPGDGEVMPDYAANPAAFNQWAQRNGVGTKGLKGITARVTNSAPNRGGF